jgi:hypothetical protein
MLILAICLFAFAALLGMYLLSFILQDKNTPKAISFIHGPIAALALIILIIYCMMYSNSPLISMIIFILAALVGFVLIFRDLTGRPIPKWLAISHGLVAVIGFLCLLLFVFL